MTQWYNNAKAEGKTTKKKKKRADSTSCKGVKSALNKANSDFSDGGGQTAKYKTDCGTYANVYLRLHIQNSNLNFAALN